MNQIWKWIVGTALSVAVILGIFALVFVALVVDGEDWDDDAGKGL